MISKSLGFTSGIVLNRTHESLNYQYYLPSIIFYNLTKFNIKYNRGIKIIEYILEWNLSQICEVHLQYGNSKNKMAVLHFFLVNSPLIYILFSLTTDPAVHTKSLV